MDDSNKQDVEVNDGHWQRLPQCVDLPPTPNSWLPLLDAIRQAIPDSRKRDRLIIAYWNDLKAGWQRLPQREASGELVQFFRDEAPGWGQIGDDKGWTTEQTAVAVMRDLQHQLEASRHRAATLKADLATAREARNLQAVELARLAADKARLIALVRRAATESTVTISDERPGCFYCDSIEHTADCPARAALAETTKEIP